MGLARERVVVRGQQDNKIRLLLTKLTEFAIAAWCHVVCTLGPHQPGVIEIKQFGDSGATMSKLAQAVLMDRTTLTRSIRPLERAGLLRVARSPEDARTKIVVITRAGERMSESTFPVWERVLQQIQKTLGAEVAYRAPCAARSGDCALGGRWAGLADGAFQCE
jgi:DNA-binding MarR family transcriptional regulator